MQNSGADREDTLKCANIVLYYRYYKVWVSIHLDWYAGVSHFQELKHTTS